MYPIQLKRLPGNEDVPLPRRMSEWAAGFDLHAAVAEPVVLTPGERALIPAGFAMAMPAELEAQIRPRSGLAYKHGITCLNSPGTIDADYRGEVKVLLVNLGQQPFAIERGSASRRWCSSACRRLRSRRPTSCRIRYGAQAASDIRAFEFCSGTSCRARMPRKTFFYALREPARPPRLAPHPPGGGCIR